MKWDIYLWIQPVLLRTQYMLGIVSNGEHDEYDIL